jgi:hypothetical protein
MMTQDNMIMYDQLVEQGIATPEEINLVFNVHGGDWTSVLNAILYVRTGYRSLQQMIDAESEEEEDYVPKGWTIEEWNDTKNVMESILAGLYD